MYEISRGRVLIACGLTFIGMVLALVLLTAGSRHGYLENAAFSIVPVPNPAPPHWQGLDWVALYSTVVTAGNYDPITRTRINVTISHDLSWRDIFIVERTNHHLPLAFHGAGIGCTGLAFLLLFLLFSGRFRGPGWLAILLLLSWVFLAISGVAIILDAQAPNNDKRVQQPGVAVPMQWTAVVCVFLASALQTFEYLHLKWMLSGRRRPTLHKPDGLGWFSYNSRSYLASGSRRRIKSPTQYNRGPDLELRDWEHRHMDNEDERSATSKPASSFAPSPTEYRQISSPPEYRPTQSGTRKGTLMRAQSTSNVPTIVLNSAD